MDLFLLARRLLWRLDEQLARLTPFFVSRRLETIVLEMSEALIVAKKDVAATIADEKRLKAQEAQEAANAREWERRMVAAIDRGDEEGARDAAARKLAGEKLAAEALALWEEQERAVRELKRQLREFSGRVDDMKRRKNLLAGRLRASGTRRSLARLGITLDVAGSWLREVEQWVEERVLSG